MCVPGGIVAFQEWHPIDSFLAEPPVELWTATGDTLLETFRAAGTNVRLGLSLRAAYLAAGLPAPGCVWSGSPVADLTTSGTRSSLA